MNSAEMTIKQKKIVPIYNHPDHKGALLERAFQEHGPALQRFLRARLALAEDREDIVQDLFVRLARTDGLAEKLSERSGNTRSYLFSIATNLIVDMKRKQMVREASHHDSYEEEAAPTPHPTPEMIIMTQEQVGVMKQLLATIKPKPRQAFVLSRYLHKSYSEIADEMGVSVSTVEKYVSSALSTLREGLQ